MACLPKAKLLRLVTGLIIAGFAGPSVAQVTEEEINALVERGQADIDQSEIEALVRSAQERQTVETESARKAVEGSVSVETAIREEYGIELQSDAGQSLDDPTLYIFVSFSMPDNLIREYLQDALRFGGRVVVRGLINGSIPETQKKLSQLIEEDETRQIGAAVDPRAFEAFGVEVVPAIAVGEHAVARCESEDCDVRIGRHDIMYGSVSVEYALEQFAKRGDVRAKARAHLNRGR